MRRMVRFAGMFESYPDANGAFASRLLSRTARVVVARHGVAATNNPLVAVSAATTAIAAPALAASATTPASSAPSAKPASRQKR